MGDITENYPQGYIQAGSSTQPSSQAVVTLQDKIQEKVSQLKSQGYSEVSANVYEKKEGNKTITVRINDTTGEITTTTSTEGTTSTAPTSEYQALQQKINKAERALKTAEGRSYDIINQRLQDLYEAQRNLEKTGTAFITVKAPESSRETIKDIIVTPSGFQSKAYELQTPQEKERTAQFYSDYGFQSTSEGLVSTKQPYVPTIQYSVYTERLEPTITTSTIPQGSVLPTSEAFPGEYKGAETIGEALTRKGEALQTKGIMEGETGGLYTVAGGALRLGGGVFTGIVGGFKAVENPIGSIYETGKSVYTGELGVYAKENPLEFTGQLASFKIVDVISTTGKDVYVSTGSKYIPPEKVFDVGVLEGKTKFPETKSIPESLSRFSESNKVVSAMPEKLTGTTVGEGSRAIAGLEDPGIYVTPKGSASPAFLGLSEAEYKFNINPVSPITQIFKEPTLTEFEVRGVALQPRQVVAQPGFEATRVFFEEEGAKTGKAYITKRSELGQGNIQPQLFVEPIAGKTILEKGTPEIEAVIPITAEFEYTPTTRIGRIKGFEEYTKFEGRNVPIRTAKVLEKTGEVPELNTRVISGERVYEESSRVLSSRSSSPSYRPLSTYSSPSVSSSSLSLSSKSYGSSDKSLSVSESSSISPSGSSELKLSTPTSSTISETTSITSTSYTPSTPRYPTPSITTSYTPYPPPRVPIKQTPDFNLSPRETKSSKRFKLFVRERGKFKVRDVGSDVGELSLKGQDVLRQTARASYKIVNEAGSTEQIDIPRGFTKSKRELGVIVQPRELRISSRGEKEEISYAGIRAQRKGFNKLRL